MSQVKIWYERAQIDYVNQYMALYAAFNAWYSTKTRTHNDRQAINILRMGCDVWEAYVVGKSMRDLRYFMEQLVECTQRSPMSYATPHWKGEVGSIYDWESLIEYWYRVRCIVMHGSEIAPMYVYLAYETLNIFMGEVIERSGD